MSFSAYSEYKDSGMEWLGNVPNYWQVCRIDGRVDTSTECVGAEELDGQEVFHYSIPVVQDTGDGQFENGSYISSSKLIISEPQVILSKLNPRKGTVCIAEPTKVLTVCSGEFVPLIPRKVELRYLLYLVQTANFRMRLESLVESATRSHQRVLPAHIVKTYWAFPCDDEQKAISWFLDAETAKIDALVSEQRRLIELLKEKRQAVISHAVTKGLNPDAPMKPSGIQWLGNIPLHWTIPPLYTRFEQVLGKMLDEQKIIGDNLTPYIRNIDVQWDRVNADNLPLMDIKLEERERFMIRRGDVLVCEGGEVGRTAIWEGSDNIIAFQKAIHRLRPLDSSEYNRFFFYIMRFAAGMNVFLTNSNPNTIPHLTGEQLRHYRFPKPPVDEQIAISNFLDERTTKLDDLVREAERSIELLQERRTALISAAVTGKIDVRGAVKTGVQL